MYAIDTLINQYSKERKLSKLHEKILRWILPRLFHEKEFIEFEKKYPSLKGIDCIDEILRYFEFRCESDSADLENIPSHGTVIFIANHPTGSLDGLALLKMISSVRPDVKTISNRIFSHVKALSDIFILVDNMGGQTQRSQIREIHEHLRNKGALIVFPAGEVSRLTPKGIKDRRWNGGFVKLASRVHASIVPVHVKGRNSVLFYLLSMIYKPLSTYFLIDEMFKQKGKSIKVRIGKRIPYEYWNNSKVSPAQIAKSLKKHVYQIGKGKKGHIKGEAPIALPSERIALKSALEKCEILGKTSDDKSIYLYKRGEEEAFSPILHELGRLREIAFRAVGEGSGRRLDLDCYDNYYCHLILWDNHQLDIVGAYRFMPTDEYKNTKMLYSDTLFDYNENMSEILKQSIELGRSFIQPKYWGKKGLDYLWQGIGAYVAKNQKYRYLFGPVSISSSIPIAARDLLVAFYRLYFAPKNMIAASKRPYPSTKLLALEKFNGNDYKNDMRILKSMLNNMNCGIPTLYKQYSELCEEEGVQFMDFGIDPDFNDCIDGLVFVDISMLKNSRYERYIAPYLPKSSIGRKGQGKTAA
ncbi:MAG: lysophospholipid acyltransferase family protein [Campylobacteraceae bacterium]|jgi:putative hemolysin|nr:lysophospholipid acyltransferase family protein [Campylobacteraceae bacterium]